SIVDRPLFGKRVLVTRAKPQAGDLSVRLAELGATPVELPAIEIGPAATGPIDEAIRRLDLYDWIVFTSGNGVVAFLGRLGELGTDLRSRPRLKVAAIGRATAERLEHVGVEVEFIPERFVAESVVEGMTALGIEGKRVLLPRADIARDTLPEGLRAAGATVDVVEAYRTQRPTALTVTAISAMLADGIDFATFASPSSVRNFVELIGSDRLKAQVVCIGPITADAARVAGLIVDAVADEYSIPGLVASLVRLAQEEGEEGREVPSGPAA
ncbi:MAG: uroporphyrinogen-III synthase, partial [Vicinamibacterales bacterium]